VSDATRRTVGLNLDIPHWGFLSGISPKWLLQSDNALIRRRVVHAHVSDHNTGHFSDNPIGSFHDLKIFKDWFETLRIIQGENRSSGMPRFSGFVSCEMEACKCSGFLHASCDTLVKL